MDKKSLSRNILEVLKTSKHKLFGMKDTIFMTIVSKGVTYQIISLNTYKQELSAKNEAGEVITLSAEEFVKLMSESTRKVFSIIFDGGYGEEVVGVRFQTRHGYKPTLLNPFLGKKGTLGIINLGDDSDVTPSVFVKFENKSNGLGEMISYPLFMFLKYNFSKDLSGKTMADHMLEARGIEETVDELTTTAEEDVNSSAPAKTSDELCTFGKGEPVMWNGITCNVISLHRESNRVILKVVESSESISAEPNNVVRIIKEGDLVCVKGPNDVKFVMYTSGMSKDNMSVVVDLELKKKLMEYID